MSPDGQATAVEPPRPDPESRAWLAGLAAHGRAREEAARRLHAVLLRVARVHLLRRAWRPELRGEELDDVAAEAAAEAVLRVLAHLDEFRGASRFTTWACRFAINEASLALRRRRWKGRELPVEAGSWPPHGRASAGPDDELEHLELIERLQRAVSELTDWQREVFVAVALNEVPIAVLASSRGKTRGAVYKTLHDARRKLQCHLALE